ncbi:MAG: DoxX family membrane protein [Frankiales bacterium]|nr:DoxX family membrane protein [Frankiales bacterium]
MSTALHQSAETTVAADPITNSAAQSFAGLVRILLGFTFLWAFFDKTFAWGYTTTKAWLFGTGDGNPTAGFLKFGANPNGPFVDFFNGLAPTSSSAFINWLFMLALLGAGVGLVLGIGMRISCIGATILLLSMWLAVAPWAKYIDQGGSTVASNNPLLDEHIIYSATLMLLMFAMGGRYWGLGRWWESRVPAWLV